MTAPHNGTETSITAAKKVDESGRAAALRDKIYNWFLERGPTLV